jgi:hypothetical protein
MLRQPNLQSCVCSMAIVATTACAQSTLIPSQLGTVEQLVDALRREGLIVSVGDKISPGYLSVPARRVTVNAETLYVFEYSTATQAATDAAQISPDAQADPRTRITWVNTRTRNRSRAHSLHDRRCPIRLNRQSAWRAREPPKPMQSE